MKGPLIYYEIQHMYGANLSNTKLANELRKSILEDISLGFNVEIDFKNVVSVSKVWAKNLIGSIIKDKSEDFIKNHISFINMNKNVKAKIIGYFNETIQS